MSDLLAEADEHPEYIEALEFAHNFQPQGGD